VVEGRIEIRHLLAPAQAERVEAGVLVAAHAVRG